MLAGIIKSRSAKSGMFFGFEKDKFEFVKSIDDLIPSGISTIHDALVTNFFQVGSSGYFRNAGVSLSKLQSGFVQPIELLFDVNFTTTDDFSFITFIKKHASKNIFFIVDDKGKIGTELTD